MDQQQYCLKWSNYSSNLAAAFSNLFDSATLTDVTPSSTATTGLKQLDNNNNIVHLEQQEPVAKTAQ
uniref:Uncharacterized protein n=1 Tax=Anopheles quadriannulatus TaxID=34691 RepID=A0A182XGV8_ANOQN